MSQLPPNSRLTSRSFLALVVTQALGTINDNMYRWLAVPIAEVLLGGEEQTQFALSAGLFCFTLPYLLLATHAGFLADRFSKRQVILGCKVAEVFIALLGLLAIWSSNLFLLFAVVALFGCQSALFGPAKFGSIPELLAPEKLSAGNGVMALVTVTASAAGLIFGFALYGLTAPTGIDRIWISGLALVGTAVAGLGASCLISPRAAAQPLLPFPHNPLAGTWIQLRLLLARPPLLRTALGIAFFWSLASLAQMNIAVYGAEMHFSDSDVSLLMAVLVAGVGTGSVLAGIWSAGKVELGLVPLGALGIIIGSLSLFLSGGDGTVAHPVAILQLYRWSCVWMFVIGFSAGLFNVPLDSFLQQRSPPAIRGNILAAGNFLAFTGILMAAGLFYVLQAGLNLSAQTTFLLAGLGTIPVALYVFLLLPDATIRFVAWLASHTIYRLGVYGRGHLPTTGGALLVANHVSWIDGILLLISSSRPIRMLAYADYVKGFGVRWLARVMGVIPIRESDGPKALLRSLQTARQAILDGELVCIFAEGSLTRTGQLQPFQRGFLKIVEGTGAPVIPVYLDNLWGSIFSYSAGRFFWKLPRRWRYPVSILFGTPRPEPVTVHQIRQAVQDLGVDAMEQRKRWNRVLPRVFLRKCRRQMFHPKLADSSGAELTGGQTLLKTFVLKRMLEREVLARDERMVGVLLPPSVAGALVNTALTLAGRIPVNLNYTASQGVMNECIAQCGITHVLTSRKLVDKLKPELNAELVILEDYVGRVSTTDKLVGALQAFATPVVLLERLFGLTRIRPDDLMTIIFTSGSTGEPKGVMLSFDNVGSNIEAIDHLFHLTPTDVLLGVLPFFHSFGFTANLWMPLTLDPKGVFHFNPLDARVIGELCEKHKVTILMAAPTFLRTYWKRCEPQQLKTLDLVIVGAEKMPLDLAQGFEDKFGVRPIEGYGTTELSPVAAVNVPDHRSTGVVQRGTKEGSVGRPLPGTSAKIIDPDTGADLDIDQPGLLLIKGPNVMQGYLNKPELTAQALHDGWYTTGDIARIDTEGFIHITDRLSRFSKIGGEMVPHIKVEDMLRQLLVTGSDEDQELRIVVTAIPDEKKGERLVVIHKPLSKSIDELWTELSASGLPNLWVPARDSFLQVDEIPVLGTGKLDLRSIKALALERFGVLATTG